MSGPSPAWSPRVEVVAAIAALIAWVVGLHLRFVSFDATPLDQAAIHPHFYATLIGIGEPWPALGPPAAFFLRHGTVPASILALAQPFVDSLSDSAHVQVFVRSLTIPGLYLLGRALGAPALGLAAAAAHAVAPETVNLDRHTGGTNMLDALLVVAMLGLAAGRRASTWRLAATAFVVSCLPLAHPMGLPGLVGLGLAGALLLRDRTPRERGVVVGAALLPLLPYAIGEIQSGFGGTRSILAMLTGSQSFSAPGEESVGLGWTLSLLLKDPAPPPLAALAAGAFALGGPIAVALLVRSAGRSRWGTPLLGYAATAGAFLLLLLAVQGGADYGYGHHVMSGFLIGIALCAAAWGRFADHRWADPARRRRAEVVAAAVLGLSLLPFLPRDAINSSEGARHWAHGMSTIGSTAAMADLIAAERGGGPMHLAVLHAPSDDHMPAVALSAVVLDLLQGGMPLSDLPRTPPGGPVEGWLITVGAHDATPPGVELPFDDPHPQPDEVPVRVWRSEDFLVQKAWAEALGDGWELYGTEEYQDLIEYFGARPRWPGRDGNLPVMDTPYRSSEW